VKAGRRLSSYTRIKYEVESKYDPIYALIELECILVTHVGDKKLGNSKETQVKRVSCGHRAWVTRYPGDECEPQGGTL
jgi:hypothetical protein